MTRHLMTTMGLGILAAGTALSAGGWAVTTITDLPDYAVAGTPVRLELVVRQHGVHLGAASHVRLEASFGDQRLHARVAPTDKPGYYVAQIMFPAAGLWRLTAATGLAGTTRVNLQVVSAGAPPPILDAAARGRLLFSAKGCVTCHIHGAITGAESMNVGPELTDRRYPADLLKARLSTPAPCVSGMPCMPDLDLGTNEVSALVAFINTATTAQAATVGTTAKAGMVRRP